MAQPDTARISATARIALPRLIAGDPEVVHVRLQEQAHRYTSPICVICWDGLCGFDTDVGEERVVVSWNSCGGFRSLMGYRLAVTKRLFLHSDLQATPFTNLASRALSPRHKSRDYFD